MRKIFYCALVLILILLAGSCNLTGKGDERYISFDANGGEGVMPKQLYMVGIPQSISTNAFVKDGYRFKNWNTRQDNTGTSYVAGATVTFDKKESNITLYAIWTRADTYTIHFIDTLGSGVYEQDVVYDVSTQLTSIEELGLEKHPGYDLNLDSLWNTKINGTGNRYGDSYTVRNLAEPGETANLYVQWNGWVNYDKNGGEALTGNIPRTQITLYNKVKKISDNKRNDGGDYYRYDDAVFTGWTNLPNNRIDGVFYEAGQAVESGFSANTTLYAYWQFYYTSFTVDKDTVIQHRQQNTITDPKLLEDSKYIILSSGPLYATERLSYDGPPVTEKYGMGEFSYVIKDYKVQELKDKGQGDVYYKDNPDIKVIVLYTIPSGTWLDTLPSKKLLQSLGNSTGSRDDRIDRDLFISISDDPTAQAWSGSGLSDNGWMLQLSETEYNWTLQDKTTFTKRYQTALY